jgi:hypothetical protein
VDVLNDGEKSLVTYTFAILVGHTRIAMAHDVIDGNLIPRFARDRFKSVTQAIEAVTGTVQL